MSEPDLTSCIVEVGATLGYDVVTEVEASESAWVDVVWFDKRLPISALATAKPKTRFAPVLPIVGFEIEVHTGLSAKHVKGSVANLNNLGAQLGVVVVGSANVAKVRGIAMYAKLTDAQVVQVVRERIYRWVYAEARPEGRIILMFEDEVRAWAAKLQSYAATA